MKKSNLMVGLTTLLFLGACASSIERVDPKVSYKYEGQKFQSVEITVSDKAKKDLADNPKFDLVEFKNVLMRTLESKGLLQNSSDHNLNVLITDVRVRGTFTAIFWGFMAGADYVNGLVTIVDSANQSKHKFVSKASWALGGLGGGQDRSRLEWMYEKFSENTADEILGLKTSQKK